MTARGRGPIRLIVPLVAIPTSAFVPPKVCTLTNTSREGLAALGTVPSRFAFDPAAEICLAAPCRCTIPDPSANHPGLAEPNPAFGDQLTPLTLIGWTGPDRLKVNPLQRDEGVVLDRRRPRADQAWLHCLRVLGAVLE